MAMIVILSAKGAPGASTAVATLATVWPARLVVADCDPQGGDLAVGWLARWWMDGYLADHRGVLSFATATRHTTQVTAELLREHLQPVPAGGDVHLLVGLRDAAQGASVAEAGWRRLATALAGLTGGEASCADVLVDGGRFGPDTPWPLMTSADLVLLAVRPVPRHLLAARPVVELLSERIPPDRLGLVIRAAGKADAAEAVRVLALPAGVTLPEDVDAARVFSDGSDPPPRLGRSLLVRVASTAARRLHTTLNPIGDPVATPAARPTGVLVRPVLGARS